MNPVAGIGYEGRSVHDVVKAVSLAGITVVVDVRLNAISRKAGLSKKALQSHLAEAGIRYAHLSDLGNPKDNREAFRNGESGARSRYAKLLANGSSASVDSVLDIASSETVALLCYEREASQCHRSAINDELAQRDPSIRVVDL